MRKKNLIALCLVLFSSIALFGQQAKGILLSNDLIGLDNSLELTLNNDGLIIFILASYYPGPSYMEQFSLDIVKKAYELHEKIGPVFLTAYGVVALRGPEGEGAHMELWRFAPLGLHDEAFGLQRRLEGEGAERVEELRLERGPLADELGRARAIPQADKDELAPVLPRKKPAPQGDRLANALRDVSRPDDHVEPPYFEIS